MVHDAFFNYGKPVRIKCYVEVKDGKTIVTYSGTAKDDEYYNQFEFDYVIVEQARNLWGVISEVKRFAVNEALLLF